jgi:hypothetical protein
VCVCGGGGAKKKRKPIWNGKLASSVWIPFVTGFTRRSNVLGCLPPAGLPRKTILMPLLTLSGAVGELLTEHSLCGAITGCCWCFCGEMRAGKLSVFVHWIRLRTILTRSTETTVTAVAGYCFVPDGPFCSRRPYFFVYKSFITLSLFSLAQGIITAYHREVSYSRLFPILVFAVTWNHRHLFSFTFCLYTLRTARCPVACVTICSNKATVRVFFQLLLLVQS